MRFSRAPTGQTLVLVIWLSGCAAITYSRAALPIQDVAGGSPTSNTEFLTDLVPLRRVDHRGATPVAPFATYGQCQIDLPLAEAKCAGLSAIKMECTAKIRLCLEIAERERIQVLIFPELALAFEGSTRRALLNEMKESAKRNNMIIVAGSYYDAQRFSRLVVVGPSWYEEGYKVRPSRYESSPVYGLGMRPGLSLLLIDSPYGRIMPITCVDIISDSVQYQARNLANRGQLDVLVNLNYDPASWEFLVEANSIARRHGIFVTVTNMSVWPSAKDACIRDGDNGSCGGNTALFGSIRANPNDCPNCEQSLLPQLPASFLSSGKRSIPFDSLVADIPPLKEGLLVYDLNLRLLREPSSTNTPDQGYPTIRNVRTIPLRADDLDVVLRRSRSLGGVTGTRQL